MEFEFLAFAFSYNPRHGHDVNTRSTLYCDTERYSHIFVAAPSDIYLYRRTLHNLTLYQLAVLIIGNVFKSYDAFSDLVDEV
jgi:hypothetical protein